ncbi:MAG: hypothetical protein E6344_05530 [Clostridium sp.]|uniref:hypothetical protein n=1 Tax=Clostridium culturomicium TaxID=1499683 RepID=UPI0012E0BF90|nr:hypothetical protein [Clostridium culturomicium]MDU4889224.1 hypothetical protein [Clostridium sp.]MDU7083132.1 hypothetical protein [Clostridium sp.]
MNEIMELPPTELDELMEIFDRIMVMYDVKIMGIFDQRNVTRKGLGLLMAGVVN